MKWTEDFIMMNLKTWMLKINLRAVMWDNNWVPIVKDKMKFWDKAFIIKPENNYYVLLILLHFSDFGSSL